MRDITNARVLFNTCQMQGKKPIEIALEMLNKDIDPVSAAQVLREKNIRAQAAGNSIVIRTGTSTVTVARTASV